MYIPGVFFQKKKLSIETLQENFQMYPFTFNSFVLMLEHRFFSESLSFYLFISK